MLVQLDLIYSQDRRSRSHEEETRADWMADRDVARANKSSAVAEMGDRGHNRHGPKRGGCYAPFAGRAGSPSNTMWPGPRPTSIPSGILMHPAVWPQ